MTTLEKILVLQERDRRLIQLEQETSDIPERKRLIDSRLQAHRDEVAAYQDKLMHNASAMKQIELEVDSMKEKIRKLREQQGKIKSNDEYRAIEREIGNFQKDIRKEEDSEIKIMEEAESLKSQSAEIEKVLAEEESVVQDDMGALDARLKNIQEEIEGLKKERDALAAEIDEEWYSRYNRIFMNKKDYALVPIEQNGSCGGCHMKLPPQVLQDVKKASSMVSCSYCGRILYWMP